jgi:hypothetical protein
MLRAAVGSKPAILGTKKLGVKYRCMPGYLEADNDLTASSIANNIWGVVQRFAGKSVIDLAFVIESQTTGELPEQLLATCRFYRGRFVQRLDDA